jgi:predicted RNase H-like HicB family nuclease
MAVRYILSDYVTAAMSLASIKRLEDGSFAGRIAGCEGVLAFAESEDECHAELRSVLEDWVLLGLKLKHALPVIAGIDLNQEPQLEPADAL